MLNNFNEIKTKNESMMKRVFEEKAGIKNATQKINIISVEIEENITEVENLKNLFKDKLFCDESALFSKCEEPCLFVLSFFDMGSFCQSSSDEL